MNLNEKNAEDILSKMGYTTPETYTQNPNSLYMTYSGEDYVPGNHSVYSSYESYGDNKQIEKPENSKVNKKICPKCNQKAKFICDCDYEEMACSNGHMWYYTNNTLKIGDPHLSN
jgi:hypothetical protein